MMNKKLSRELVIVYSVILVKLAIVLFFAWQCACVNSNYNFFEAFYGYAGAQNARKYSSFLSRLLQLANFMDFSSSSNAACHPYYYLNNMDMSNLLNTVFVSIGFGKCSYIAANLFTAICRTLALYLYYSIFKYLTDSFRIALIAMIFLATDYLFFDVPLFNPNRGTEFTLCGIFLYGVFLYHRGNKKLYHNIYFYISLIGIYLANYSGYWLPVGMFFLGLFLIVFRQARMKLEKYVLMISIGVIFPFIYKNALIIGKIGFYETIVNSKITQQTKMFLPNNSFNFDRGTIYAFFDSLRIVCWPFYPLDLHTAIQQYFWGIQQTFVYIYQAIDYGTLFTACIVFTVIIISNFTINKRLTKNQRHITFYTLSITLSIILTYVLFPGYYYFLVYLNPYLIMPVVCLIVAYVINYLFEKFLKMRLIWKCFVAIFLLVLVFFRVENNWYYYHLLPIKEDMQPKVLQNYCNMPVATTNVNNYPIYHAFTDNYSTYIQERDINEHPPFDVGQSFVINARDQFEKRNYSYPEIIVLYVNRFDRFLDSIAGMPSVKKYKRVTNEQIDEGIKQYFKEMLKDVSTDRILYNDGNLVVLKVKDIDGNKDRIYRRLDSITKLCLDKYLKDDFNLEKFWPILDYFYNEIFINNTETIGNSNYSSYSKFRNWVERLHYDKNRAESKLCIYNVYSEIKTYQQDVLMPKIASPLTSLSYDDGYCIILMLLLAQDPTIVRLWDAPTFDKIFNTYYPFLPLTLKETAMKIKDYNLRTGPFDPIRIMIWNKILKTHEKNKVYVKKQKKVM